LLNHPNNALQLLHLFILDSGNQSNINEILDLLSKTNDSILRQIFSPEASFYKESDADVFTDEGKTNFISGAKGPTKEGNPIEPETLEEAMRLLARQELIQEQLILSHRDEIHKLLEQIKLLKTKNLESAAEAARSNSIYQNIFNFPFKSEFRLFTLDYTLLFESQSPLEFRSNCQETIDGANKAWRTAVHALLNKTSREGKASIPDTPEHEKLKVLNNARDRIIEFLKQQIAVSLQNDSIVQ
jgi:hypothetical protein